MSNIEKLFLYSYLVYAVICVIGVFALALDNELDAYSFLGGVAIVIGAYFVLKYRELKS